MCYYNGQRVSRDEYIRLKSLEKQIDAHQTLQAVVNGFAYEDSIILKATANKQHFDLVEAHWEFIPPWVESMDDLKLIRRGIDPKTGAKRVAIPWLNATAENMLYNSQGKPSMFRNAALKGRCLVLSAGFYDTQHVGKEKYPYYITVKGIPYYFMAGVCQMWTDKKTGETMDTYAIVTTKANALMERIHNVKKRMPTIFTENLAWEWLFNDLSEQRIQEIASYQYPSEQMQAHTIYKDYLLREDPTEACEYLQQTDLFS